MRMALGVTGAVLLAMGFLAGPAQAFLVEGPRGASGGAAYHALLSSEK